ncbi:MAG: T9SS type A sorting domain-containing protein [Ignavibacteriaceae bacterium]
MFLSLKKSLLIITLALTSNLSFSQQLWEKVIDGDSTSFVHQIQFDLKGNSYIAAEKGLFKIFKNDFSFEKIYQLDYWNYFISVLVINENEILAGTNSGIIESRDGGKTWAENSLDSSYIEFITMDENGIIYTGWNPIYKSTDSGKNWELLNNQLYAYNFYITLSGKFLAGTDRGIYLSEDNGINWILSGFNYGDITAIAGNNSESPIFIGGSDRLQGVYYSENEGYDWDYLNNSDSVKDIRAILPINRSIIYLGSFPFGLFKYNLLNSSLEHLNLPVNIITSLALDSLGYLYAGTYGVYKTTNPVDSMKFLRNSNYNFSLSQNYPNPFNANTTIEYSIESPSEVNISVFNILGEKISEIYNSFQDKGNYKLNFNSNSLSSGIYFYQMRTHKFCETKKMILLK